MSDEDLEALEQYLRAGLPDLNETAADAIVILRDRIAALEAENARLREALEWYANPSIYKPHPHGLHFDDRDLSFKARAALEGK